MKLTGRHAKPWAVSLPLLLAIFAALDCGELWAQSIRLGAIGITNQSVRLQVEGPTNQYIRVDASSDLLNWLPVDLYLDTGAPHLTTDTFTTVNDVQFYRALTVTPTLEILTMSPMKGSAGTAVKLIGQFYPPNSQFVVNFGQTPATVISNTATTMTVIVPNGAATCLISVGDTAGSVTSEDVFIVTADAMVDFQPPSRVFGTNFVVENFYGAGVLLSNSPTQYHLPVRVGSPTLTLAYPPDQASNLFFCAISFGPGQPIALDAFSTACALVYQNDNLFTMDPNLGPMVMGLIVTNAAVQTFAQTLTQAMSTSATPFQIQVVTNAFQAAVISVVNGEAFADLANFWAMAVPTNSLKAPVSSRREKGGEKTGGQNPFQIFPIEYLSTRFLQVDSKGSGLSAGISDIKIFNPVDWLVVFQDIDVDTAFPDGVLDFNPIWRTWETTPQVYPTKGVFYAETSVGADLATSRLNVVGFLEKSLLKALVPKWTDDSISIPGGNAMYLVRGVGPALVTPEDVSFVNANMQGLYVQSVAINLANAAFELAGLVVDNSGADLVNSSAAYKDLLVSIIQQSGGITTADDFKKAAFALTSSLLRDYLKSGVKEALGEILQVEGGNLVPINATLKTASKVGQLAERASGLFRTTALETTLVEVGDPFSLSVAVNPAIASPGQIVNVTFGGSPSLKPFNINDTVHNVVTFEGPSFFNGEVTSVTGPDTSGFQRLAVFIPESLGSTHDGVYTMILRTQGRAGSTPFTVSAAGALRKVTPLDGFAASSNFLGSPFSGSSVRLQGAVFTAFDRFVFSGNGSNGVPATSVQANSFSGDVTVNVPSGAVTGPITILHKLNNGNTLPITGPSFTVWGAPVFASVEPAGGAAIGDYVDLKVAPTGTDPSLVYVQFSGTTARHATLLPNGDVVAVIPTGATNGTVAVLTPAGSNSKPYEVFAAPPITNPPVGPFITVSPYSGITLDQAMSFANGDSLPSLVQGTNGISTYNINPVDPTAWHLGKAYSDTILVSVTNSEDFTMALNFVSITVTYPGALAGNILVTGGHNTFSGVFRGSITNLADYNSYSGIVGGALWIAGYSNTVGSGTFNGPVTITGTNTTVRYGFSGSAPMLIAGESTFIGGATITGASGTAFTILGDGNSGTINCVSNSGDGLLINGGSDNVITVSAIGNAGNGVTLTNGAADNQVTVATGLYGTQGYGQAGTGNAGHGVALMGYAFGNEILSQSPALGGNGMDGLYLDGQGVIFNTFRGSCWYNGRNGITITNGASGNSIGFLAEPFYDAYHSTPAIADYNGGSGVYCANCGVNEINVIAQSNGFYGFFASNVKVDPEDTFNLAIDTAAMGTANPLAIAGNGKAGVRLESGTTGMNIYATLQKDHNGIEVAGSDTTNNIITATIASALGNGLFLSDGANSNEFLVGIAYSMADGVLLENASNNVIAVNSSFSNAVNGIHLTADSANNFFTSGNLGPYSGPNIGVDVESNAADGLLIEFGSHDNAFDTLTVLANGTDGFAFSGSDVSNNVVVRSTTWLNGRDGVRFELGANNNVIGSEEEYLANLGPDMQIDGNGEAGVYITDPGTGGNLVQNAYMSRNFPGSTNGVQPAGVIVANRANVGQITISTLISNNWGVLLRDGANGGTLSGVTISQNDTAGIFVSNAFNLLIGGPQDTEHNEINANPTGIEISGRMATNNQIINNHIAQSGNAIFVHNDAQFNYVLGRNRLETNSVGVLFERASNNLVSSCLITNNQTAGVIIALASVSNTVSSCTISNNGLGVLVTDAGSVGNTISANSISDNQSNGIVLNAGGNNLIPPPTLMTYGNMMVRGTDSAPDGSIIEIFADADGEGQFYLGSGLTVNGAFSVPLSTNLAALGLGLNFNGTVTDTNGNTSEFSGFQPPSEILGGKFVYTSTQSGTSQIFLWKSATNSVDLSQATNPDSNPSLAVGTACDKIAFVSVRSSLQSIFVMDAVANTSSQQVTSGPGDGNPAWLVPCQTIVFDSTRNGNSQVYSVNVDGSNLQRLTADTFSDTFPSPTPDGTKIIYVSTESISAGLWIMNADGSGRKLLASIPGVPKQPIVSPDGMFVAVSVLLASGASEIGVVDINGGGYMQLTSDGRQASHPAWLPDEQTILFSSNRSGVRQLYSMDRSGASVKLVPTSPNNFDAEWPTVGGP